MADSYLLLAGEDTQVSAPGYPQKQQGRLPESLVATTGLSANLTVKEYLFSGEDNGRDVNRT
jgi:hypothetical protein